MARINGSQSSNPAAVCARLCFLSRLEHSLKKGQVGGGGCGVEDVRRCAFSSLLPSGDPELDAEPAEPAEPVQKPPSPKLTPNGPGPHASQQPRTIPRPIQI